MASLQVPAKALPARPHLGFLKKLAKQRLATLRADRPSSKLAQAQLAIAREHGFSSWRKLKTEVEHRGRQNSPDAELIAKFAEAIRLGDAPLIRRMLRDTPALANVDTGGGATPLHRAAEWNQVPVLKLLLAAGANPAAKFGRYGHTPMSWAVTVGAFDTVDALVQAGVKPDLFCAAGRGNVLEVSAFFDGTGNLVANPSQTGSSRYAADGTLLPCPPTTDVEIISDALYAAARNGRTDAVRELLKHDPDLAFRAYIGGTPLHWAYYSGSTETVDVLLAAGADPSLRDDAVRCTPRAFAICVPASWGNIHLVRERLAHDPTLANIFEGRGTPLHEAARSGHVAICKLLIEAGADPLIRDAEGKTASVLAKEKSHAKVVELLADGNMDSTVANSLLDAFLDASVPLPQSHHKSGSLEPARKMLAEHPELPRVSIFAAAVAGDVNAMKKLLEASPSLAAARGGIRNWPTLCYLTFSRFLRDEKKRAGDFVKSAKLLLDHGADPNSWWPSPTDPTFRETALYGAAGIANSAPLTRLLLQAGASLESDDESLYHAAEFTDNAALRMLLKSKPDSRSVSYNLCHKMDMEDPAGVRLFIQNGADVNVLLDRGVFAGSRPLHFAIYRRRSLKILRLLLKAGADPNLPDRNGVTPCQLARKLGQNAVAELLRSKGADDHLDPRTRFLAALSSGDRAAAHAMLRSDPALKNGWSPQDHKLLVDAAEAGNVKGIRLMLDVGFPITARGCSYGGWDCSALDQAAWNGHAAAVRLLLVRGADPTAKHGYGGDALGAAIHGATTGHHQRGFATVRTIAKVVSDERLERAIENARLESETKLLPLLQNILHERKSAAAEEHDDRVKH